MAFVEGYGEPVELRGCTEFEKFQVNYSWDIHDFPTFFPFPGDTTNPNRFYKVSSPVFAMGKGNPAESLWEVNASLTLEDDIRYFGLNVELRHEVTPSVKVVACAVKIVDDDDRQLALGYFNEVFDSRHDLRSHGWPQFLDLDTIHQDPEHYFKNNVLRAEFEILLYAGMMLPPSDGGLKDFTLQSRMARQKEINAQCHASVMADLFASGQLSDAVIISGENKFPVHVSILAAHSEVFQKTFETQMKEGISRVLDLSTFQARAVRLFLKYLYTGDTSAVLRSLQDDIKAAKCIQLIILSDMYMIEPLKETCFLHLMANMKPDNAGLSAVLAHYHLNDNRIKDDIGSYCRINWPILSKNQGFLNFYFRDPNAFEKLCGEHLDGFGLAEIQEPQMFPITFQEPDPDPTGDDGDGDGDEPEPIPDIENVIAVQLVQPPTVECRTVAKVVVAAYFLSLAALGLKDYVKT